MNKEKIYQILNTHNANATMIANTLGVTPQAVQKVISDGKGSRRIAEAIALICQKPLTEVFPHFKDVPSPQERKDYQRQVDKQLSKLKLA